LGRVIAHHRFGGNMKVIAVAACFALFGTFGALCAFAETNGDLASFADKRVRTFDTEGHEKAKGMRLIIEYPPSWVAEEARHPNVVQKFSRTESKRLISAMITIIKVPQAGAFTAKEVNSDSFRKKEIAKMGYHYIRGGPTAIEGETAWWATYSMERVLPTATIQAFVLHYFVITNGVLIQFQYSVGSTKGDEGLKGLFDEYVPLFQLMTARVLFPDKWKPRIR
jgi:hypothetical protein